MTLKEWMIETGRTPQDLARDMDVPQTTIYYWMKRKFSPRLSQALALVRRSGGQISYEELLYEREAATSR